MKLQTALRHPLGDGFEHRLRLPMAPAVDDDIVRVAFKPQFGIITSHPTVKRTSSPAPPLAGHSILHAPRSTRAGQAQHSLADDIALNLGGARFDCIGARAQE
jgi:hypothetical protein